MKPNYINQATPRPWRLPDLRDPEHNWTSSNILDGKGFLVADCNIIGGEKHCEANAALIVQAVNLFALHEAVARAAEGVQWAETLLLKHVEGRADHEFYLRNKREAHKAMDAALSALKAKKGQV